MFLKKLLKKKSVSDDLSLVVPEKASLQNKKAAFQKRLLTGIVSAWAVLGCVGFAGQNVVGAETTDATMSSIVTDGITVVTSGLSSLWSFITGNAYLSFSVAVSALCAVIMIFKRLVGASRR